MEKRNTDTGEHEIMINDDYCDNIDTFEIVKRKRKPNRIQRKRNLFNKTYTYIYYVSLYVDRLCRYIQTYKL